MVRKVKLMPKKRIGRVRKLAKKRKRKPGVKKRKKR